MKRGTIVISITVAIKVNLIGQVESVFCAYRCKTWSLGNN